MEITLVAVRRGVASCKAPFTQRSDASGQQQLLLADSAALWIIIDALRATARRLCVISVIDQRRAARLSLLPRPISLRRRHARPTVWWLRAEITFQMPEGTQRSAHVRHAALKSTLSLPASSNRCDRVSEVGQHRRVY